MATSSLKKKNYPYSDIGIRLNKKLPNTPRVEAVDPRVLHKKTDGGCLWSEACTDGDTICIDGVWYYTWKFKGLESDYCPSPKDPGLLIPLVCAPDSLGIRVTGAAIIDALFNLCVPEQIAKFCDWILENCLSSEEFANWVCDTILNHCLGKPEFAEAFCDWFINSLSEDSKLVGVFAEWVVDNILSKPDVIDSLCAIVLNCLNNDSEVRTKLLLIIKSCIVEDNRLDDILVESFLSCLSEQSAKDSLSSVVKNNLIGSEIYIAGQVPSCSNSSSCITWFISDDSITAECPNGSTSYVCIGGELYCLGDPNEQQVVLDPPQPEANIIEHLGSPVFHVNTRYCGPSGTTSGTYGGIYVPLGSANPETMVSNTEINAATGLIAIDSATYTSIETINGTTEIVICFDYTQFTPVNVEVYTLWDSNGSPVLPTNITASPGYDVAAGSDSECPSDVGATTFFAPPNGTYSVCLTYPVVDSTYEFKIAGIATEEAISNMVITAS